MKVKKRLELQLYVAVFLILLGAGLLIAGFTVPPVGVIDSSVLIAFGEVLTFAGAIFGIDYSYKAKIFSRYDRDNNEEGRDHHGEG